MLTPASLMENVSLPNAECDSAVMYGIMMIPIIQIIAALWFVRVHYYEDKIMRKKSNSFTIIYPCDNTWLKSQ